MVAVAVCTLLLFLLILLVLLLLLTLLLLQREGILFFGFDVLLVGAVRVATDCCVMAVFVVVDVSGSGSGLFCCFRWHMCSFCCCYCCCRWC